LAMEMPTMENPQGVYKVDGLSQLKTHGALSRQGRRNAARLQDKIVHARNQAGARGQDPDAAEAAVIAENPLTVAGGGKRGKAAPVAPPPAEAKLIEIKIKKPSPGKLNVKDELGSTLKRKYYQLSHANKKIKELEDQGKTENDCDELKDAYHDRADCEKIIRKCNKKLDDLASNELFGGSNSD